MATDAARFVYPTLARALALFTRGVASTRDPPRVIHLHLTSHRDDDDATLACALTASPAMSHPERCTAGLDDAFAAYDDVAGRVEATLDVRACSDRWVRFSRRVDGAWTTTTSIDADVDLDSEYDSTTTNTFGARLMMVFRDAVTDARTFVERTAASFAEGARVCVWPHVVAITANGKDVFDFETPAAMTRATPSTRVGIADASWCVIVRVRVEDAGTTTAETRGGAKVWIDGSMASWRVALRIVEHAFDADVSRFEAFGVEAIRRDLSDEGNPEHVVYFEPPRRARGAYVASVVVHFVRAPASVNLADVAANRVFVLALAGERTNETTLEFPDASARATASMVTNGLFDALAALKREDDGGRFLSSREAAVAERNARVGDRVLTILERATSDSARAFLSKMHEEDEQWHEAFTRALTTPVVVGNERVVSMSFSNVC